MYIFARESILEDLDDGNHDFEMESDFGDNLEMVAESISMAVQLVEKMSENVAVLEKAIHSSDESTKRQLLQVSQIHRRSLVSYYGGQNSIFATVLATEDVGSGNLIFALEEEAATEKGLIGKMIDAIKNAFKWLWEKITGIFKSTESSGDSKKENEDLMAVLQKAIDKKDEIPANTSISDDKFGKAFAGLGDSIDVGKVVESIDTQKQAGEIIKGLVSDMMDHLGKAKDMVDKMSSGGDPGTIYNEFIANTKSAVAKHLKNQLKAEQVDVYKFATAGESIAPGDSYITGDYVSTEGPSSFCVYWSTGKENKAEKGKFKAGFRVRGGLTKTATIALPSKLSDLKPLVERIVEYSNLQSEQFEEAQKLDPEGKSKRFQGDLDAIKGKLAADQKDSAKQLTLFSNYANGIGSVMTGTIQFLKAMDTSVKIYRSFVKEAIKVSGGDAGAEEKSSEEGAEKTEEAAKPETVVQQGSGETVVQKEAAPAKRKAAPKQAAETAPEPKPAKTTAKKTAKK